MISLPLPTTTTTNRIAMEEKKRRRALTDTDRLLIRKRHQTHSLEQKDLAEWFAQETGHTINQSMISKVLSSKYDYLDSMDKRKDRQLLQEKKRSSAGDWPDLEAALFE